MTESGKTAEEILEGLEVWGQRLGLERIAELLDALGRPQDHGPSVLVAGTNGKGSTSALLASIAHASGARTGLYTSPHLERVEERLRIDGLSISSSVLAELLTEVVAMAKRSGFEPPTYFEALTAAAFVHFQRQETDLAVFEVGLGGRLDATNVANPLLSLITQIGFDHQEHLGDTLPEVAGEKAGIARRHVPLLIWTKDQPEVRSRLTEIATGLGARLVPCEDEVESQESNGPLEPGLNALILDTPLRRYELEFHLAGEHQIANLALAVRAAEMLSEKGVLTLAPGTVEIGVNRCRWPGRLELVKVTEDRAVLLDGAHNLQGAEALVRYLDGLAATGSRADGGRQMAASPRDRDLLYGSLGGKRAQQVLPMLATRVREIILTEPSSDRALSAVTLDGYLSGRQPPPKVEADLSAALDLALGQSSRSLLVCGSLYVVGEVRQLLRKRFGRPEAAVLISTG